MTTASDPSATRGALGALFDRLARPNFSGVPDGELLARFARCGDQAAFTEVAHRHGAMVLGVARRVLRCESGADDVTQAAFVVLARRAGEFTGRGTVADFLHGVARRLALKARTAAARRGEVERRAARPELAEVPRDVDAGFDADQLLAHLPAKYRAAVILCDLEGVSRRDAASRLGVPEGTVSSRLDAAHKLLAARLHRLGVKLSVASILAIAATSGAPAGLVRAATAMALITAGHAPGTVPAAVLALASGGVRVMTLAKLAAGLMAIGGAAGPGGGIMAGPASAPRSLAEELAARSATPLPPGELRRVALANELEALDRGFWRLKSKSVNGKEADYKQMAELWEFALPRTASHLADATEPIDAKDWARVNLSAGSFDGTIGMLKAPHLVALKLNPHRTPRELTFTLTKSRRAGLPFGGENAAKRDDTGRLVLSVPQTEFYLACIYELSGDKLRLARYSGWNEADRPTTFDHTKREPGAPDLIVLEFERVAVEAKK